MGQSVNGIGNNNDAVAYLARRQHTITTNVAASPVTPTVDQFINGLFITAVSGAFGLTTPTAAAIVAAIPEAVVGTMFEFAIDNGGDSTLTVTGGTGVTLSGTATVATLKNKVCRGYITNVGTPAVRLLMGAQLA